MSDWNERANEIFLTAVEISDLKERLSYVASSCEADVSLRQEVDDLLNANEAAGGFLESPLSRLPPELMATGPQLVPERVGRYRIREERGEGGMGVVYRAEQEEPVRRDVAIKIIKPGLDTRQVIARFEAERQVLAMMDHPGIARVFDGGATDAGRPYFVMELVTGMAITDFCEQERLPRSQRLELFIEVCNAVQHAHQKGIIHRDLKPSNILVSRQDGRPAVKVIDFGVAKAISQHVAGSTLTRVAQWVGTPLYMSPEQASPIPIDVDTRSDVYSLGVILYELLTGTTPFDADTFQCTGEMETRRIIREDDPPYPSVRVTSLDSDMRTRLTGDERMERRKLSRQLRGELDWIVMKALEKDRERRYDSVGALSADIQRYLRDEPVAAGPPSQLYRLRKMAWRHRGPLTTIAMVLVALVVGTAAAVWQAIVATRALDVASEAQKTANEERDNAESKAREARELLYASEMRRAQDAWKANDVRTLHEILEKQIPANKDLGERGFAWHYLNKQVGVPSHVLLAAPSAMYCLQFSPDGKMIATAGAESRVHLFDAVSLKPIHSFPTDQKEVNSVEFSPDSAILYTAGDDGTVRSWNVGTRELLHSQRAHEDQVFGIAIVDSGMGMVTGGHDQKLKTWKLPGMELVNTVSFHTNAIQSIAKSPRGVYAVGSDDYRTSVWNSSSNKPLWSKTDRDGSKVNMLAFSPDGEVLAAAHSDGLMTVREASTGALLAQQAFPDLLNSLAFSPPPLEGSKSMWLAIGDRGGSVFLMPSGMSAQLSGLIATTSTDRSREWQAHKSRVYAMAFSPDGSRLLTAGEDGKVIAWEYEASRNSLRLGHKVDDFAVVDNDRVVTTGNTVRMAMLKDGSHVFEFEARPPGGDHIAIAAQSREIFFDNQHDQIFSLPMDGKAAPKIVHQGKIERGCDSFAVSADGSCLAVETLRPDRVSPIGVEFPLQKEYPLIPCTSEVHQILFARDGRLVMDQVKEVWIVEPATGKKQILSGHSSTILDFDFSPDGKNLVTVSSDRTVRVWDLASGDQLWSTVAHANGANAVAWSPTEKTIATGGVGGDLKIWRWRQGVCVLELAVPEWPVKKIAFTPDGMKMLVRADRGLRIYDATPDPAKSPTDGAAK